MISGLVEGYRQWLEGITQFAGNVFGVPSPGPTPDPPPPELPPRKWDYDPDVFAEVCELQAEWCSSDGIDRYWAGRRYRDAVSRLFPHAA